MNSQAQLKMAKAKTSLILQQPFFASLICSMPAIEDSTLDPPTMATNGKWVKYHPDFVLDATHEELVFVLCHEVGHCMLQHMYRRGSRDFKRWNQAGDYVINDMLITASIGKMPANVLHNPSLVKAGGGTTDGVYNLLPPSDKDGEGNGHGDPMDCCDDSDGTEAERAEAEAEMKVKVVQAAQAAKMRGMLPKELERFVDMALKPKVDWKDVLRRFVSAASKTDRSYARPNRRFMSQGMYLPSLIGQSMGEIMVWVDVSGSISAPEVAAFLAEIQGIKADMQPEVVHVGYFHHEVAGYDRFERDDELTLRKVGTGGTRFSPCFSYMEEETIEPVCCVVLTDLCCSDFGPQPSYPVLWVSNGLGEAPWGDVIKMERS